MTLGNINVGYVKFHYYDYPEKDTKTINLRSINNWWISACFPSTLIDAEYGSK